MTNAQVLEARDLDKTYQDGKLLVSVLKGVHFAVPSKAKIAIVGPSGSGKSTLLHLLGGLDNPSRGEVQFLGQDLTRLTEKARCQIRNQSLGFIYQFHHLLPELTALENVAMPLWLGRVSIKESQKRALSMLDDVGLLARAAHKPGQLSGGERQRVAIARALVHRPQCVLADEPTGNLDHSTATQVFDLMLRLNETHDTALVVVTHDLAIAARMDKIMHLQDGLLKDSE